MPGKTFFSNFDSVDDFAGHYIEAGPAYDSTMTLYPGKYLRHEIVKARALNNEGATAETYKPHRAYPTLQLYSFGGAWVKPSLTTMLVRVGMKFKNMPGNLTDDWLSLATFCPIQNNTWGRTVLVNLSHDGFIHAMHVPTQGLGNHLFQVTNRIMKAPRNRWFRLDIYLDLNPSTGFVKAYVDGKLHTWAEVRDTAPNSLAQVHFGLYSSASMATGWVDNRFLRMREVDNEAEALYHIEAPIVETI